MGCLPSKPKCVICQNNVSKILWPCGHFCVCDNCIIELANRRHGPNEIKFSLDLKKMNAVHCPLCRSISIPNTVYF